MKQKKPKLVFITYCVGVDIIGQPIYIKHTAYLNTYNDDSRYRKINKTS